MTLSADESAPLCPLCEYDLRATVEPRCPECGHQFDWAELRDPQRRRHPYLFEMHPQRNVWSFFRTLVGTLNPWKFWAKLSPVQAPRVGRIVLYWVICMSLLGVCAVPWIITVMWECYNAASVWGLRVWPWAFRWYSLDQIVLSPLLYLAWPWATAGSMACFRLTLRAKSLRRGHILRCVVYSADAALWLAPILLATGIYALVLRESPPRFARSPLPWTEAANPWLAGLSLVLLFALWLRLAVAYSRYLRIPHATITLFLSQVIVALAFAKVAFILHGY